MEAWLMVTSVSRSRSRSRWRSRARRAHARGGGSARWSTKVAQMPGQILHSPDGPAEEESCHQGAQDEDDDEVYRHDPLAGTQAARLAATALLGGERLAERRLRRREDDVDRRVDDRGRRGARESAARPRSAPRLVEEHL